MNVRRGMDFPATGQAKADGAHVEALVARYAPVGRRVRQSRRRLLLSRIAAAVAVPVLAALGFQGWQWRGSLPDATALTTGRSDADAARVESALAEVRELSDRVNAETGALAAQRDELARQRQRFEERGAQLLQQLETVNAQGTALAGQLHRFEEQGTKLEATLARIDSQRRELEARQARAGGSAQGVEQQLADIGRQRQRLQDQQRELRDQGELLAREIDRINSQRVELQRQREAIEQQREEVQALLNQIREVGLNRLRQKRDEAVAVARAEKRAQPPGALATMATVGDGQLSEMRAGLDVGGDYSISIGVTRTGMVNGIEQFSNSLYIDDLTNVNAGALANADTQSMIQIGSGNVITSGVAANLGDNVTTLIQNTLDNQAIATQTILDVSLQNVSAISQGISASDAVSDSLSLQR